MSVWRKINEAQEQEGVCAALAVQALQTGRDAHYYMRRAGECRALAQEFRATAKIIGPLFDARLKERADARAS